MENNPYAPSASSLGVPPAAALEREVSEFRDLSGITRTLSGLLLVGAGGHVLGAISAFMQWSLLSHMPYTMAEANANDARERLVHGGELILFLVTVIVFGRWIYLAHKNLPELEARYLRFTPGWSVGTFFVPILCLWGPYQAMADLTKASRNPRQWQLEDTPFVVIIWWTLWLIVQVLGNAALRSSKLFGTIEGLRILTMSELVSGVLSIALCFVARYLIRRVWRDQSQNHAQMQALPAA